MRSERFGRLKVKGSKVVEVRRGEEGLEATNRPQFLRSYSLLNSPSASLIEKFKIEKNIN